MVERILTAKRDRIPPLTSLFDRPCSYKLMRETLNQFSQRISSIRISLESHGEAGQDMTRAMVLVARRTGISIVVRAEPSMVVIPRKMLAFYFDLCEERGADRIQFRHGGLPQDVRPRELVALAEARSMEIQYELERPVPAHSAPMRPTQEFIDKVMAWLDAGAVNLIFNPRSVNEFGSTTEVVETIDKMFASDLAAAFGLHTVMFKAPTERVQRALLSHFAADVQLCDVSFSEVRIVERLRTELSHALENTNEGGTMIQERAKSPSWHGALEMIGERNVVNDYSLITIPKSTINLRGF